MTVLHSAPTIVELLQIYLCCHPKICRSIFEVDRFKLSTAVVVVDDVTALLAHASVCVPLNYITRGGTSRLHLNMAADAGIAHTA